MASELKAAGKKAPIILGYYADWAAASLLPPERIDYSLFTHLAHSFASVGPDGRLRLPERRLTVELNQRAHAAGVKTLLVLGGASSNGSLTKATENPAGITALASALVQAAKDGKYDGIDIDWEGIENKAQQDQMVALVRAVRARWPKGKLLTMAVPGTDWGGRWFDRAALLPLVDYLNIMAYDFHGPWTDHAGHNAAINPGAPGQDKSECRTACVSAAIDYWTKVKGWPPERLVLGLPLYGRGFRAAHWGDAATGQYEHSEPTNRDILMLMQNKWTVQPDHAAGAATLVSPDGKERISFDDAAVSTRKGKLARERHLGGIFFWEVSQDRIASGNGKHPHDFSGIRAARKGLLG